MTLQILYLVSGTYSANACESSFLIYSEIVHSRLEEFCLLNILGDMDEVECKYKDSFIELSDELNIEREYDREFLKSFFD